MCAIWCRATRLALACSALTVGATAQETAGKMDVFLRGHATLNHFSGVALVAQRGTILFERAYGLASAELNVPNALHHHFAIASITKQ